MPSKVRRKNTKASIDVVNLLDFTRTDYVMNRYRVNTGLPF